MQSLPSPLQSIYHTCDHRSGTACLQHPGGDMSPQHVHPCSPLFLAARAREASSQLESSFRSSQPLQRVAGCLVHLAAGARPLARPPPQGPAEAVQHAAQCLSGPAGNFAAVQRAAGGQGNAAKSHGALVARGCAHQRCDAPAGLRASTHACRACRLCSHQYPCHYHCITPALLANSAWTTLKPVPEEGPELNRAAQYVGRGRRAPPAQEVREAGWGQR